MARIRSRGNARTELALAALFRTHGVTGWRRHVRLGLTVVRGRRTAVRPDFVFPRERVVVFVDGCFWHGCPVHCRRPKDNAVFWRTKIEANQARDRRVHRALRRAGWSVLRVWEHALRLRTRTAEPAVVRRVRRALASGPTRLLPAAQKPDNLAELAP